MHLQRHRVADPAGRPIYSLEIADSIGSLLRRPADWPRVDLPTPASVLVLCDWGYRTKAELEPFAIWLVNMRAAHVSTWGHTAHHSGGNESLCEAVDDVSGDLLLNAFKKQLLGEEAAPETGPANQPLEVTTHFYGSDQFETILQGFLISNLKPSEPALESILILAIGNAAWADRARQLLEDPDWMPKVC